MPPFAERARAVRRSLAGSITRCLTAAGSTVIERDRLDLDARIFGQSRNADRRTRRWACGEVGRVDFVHLLEVAEVGQEHSRFHDVRHGQPFRFQDRSHAVEYASRLFRDVFGNDLAALGIEWNLTSAKNE